MDGIKQNLEDRMDEGFHRVDKRFEQVADRFEPIDKQFEQVNRRFEQMDKRFDNLGKKASGIWVIYRKSTPANGVPTLTVKADF